MLMFSNNSFIELLLNGTLSFVSGGFDFVSYEQHLCQSLMLVCSSVDEFQRQLCCGMLIPAVLKLISSVSCLPTQSEVCELLKHKYNHFLFQWYGCMKNHACADAAEDEL